MFMKANRTAMVTGGSRGIGKAIAAQLASMGYNLLIVAKDASRMKQTAKELAQQYGSKVEFFQCDISKTKEIDSLHDFCMSKGITPNILVNNAGIYHPGSSEGTIEKYDSMMAINSRGVFYLTQKLLPLIKKTKNGRIIIISSTWALDSYNAEGKEDGTVYAISKWALRGWARSLRSELRKYGIGVTIIYPGAVITDEWEGTELPHESFIQPEDIGKIVGTIVSTNDQTVIEEVTVRPLSGEMHE